MFGILLLSHGNLASELKRAVEKILSNEELMVDALSIEWSMSAEDTKKLLDEKVSLMKKKWTRLIIMTDLFGGTPTNMAMPLFREATIEIITGVNLPMIIKACDLQKTDIPFEDAAKIIQERGRDSITLASSILSKK